MIEIIQMVLILGVVFIFITGIVRYILQIIKQYKTERFGDVNNLEDFVERIRSNESDSKGSE